MKYQPDTAPRGPIITTADAVTLAELMGRDAGGWDRIAHWMRGKGFDPRSGCTLVVPRDQRPRDWARAPIWVEFSASITGELVPLMPA